MATGKFISYLRVSTQKQGASGLGLEAQRKAVEDFLNGSQRALVRELVEVESGKHADRPKLAEAMSICRLHNATLLIAKLDRLSRDAHFLLGLQKAGVKFVCADMVEATELAIGLLAIIAQHERKMISTRTKAALAAAKARGTKLGGERGNLSAEIRDRGRNSGIEVRQAAAKRRSVDLDPVLADIRVGGATTLREIATALNERGIPTARGGSWSPVQVQRVMQRIENG